MSLKKQKQGCCFRSARRREGDAMNAKVMWAAACLLASTASLAGVSLFAETHVVDPAREVPAGRGFYWVQETPRRAKAFFWMGVGRVVMVKGRSGAMAVVTVFLVSVARSASRVWKLWTGRPSSVRPVVCLATAAGERCALATTLARSASAACLSSSS